MTDLRLINLLPVLKQLPTSGLESLDGLLGVPRGSAFAASQELIAGHEDEIARVIAAECLAAARAGDESALSNEPLSVLIPTSAHVSRGAGDLRERLPPMTLREMRSLDGIDEALAQIVRDVLVSAAAAEGAPPGLGRSERVYLASVAGAVVAQLRFALRELEAPLGVVAAWSRWEHGLTTLSEASEILDQQERPIEVRRALETLGAIPLEGLGAAQRDRYDPTAGLSRLIATLDSRQRTILERRSCSLVSGPTLEELAREMGITRERVRQLESQALGVFRNGLDGRLAVGISRAAHRIRETIGAAAPLAQLRGSYAESLLESDLTRPRRLHALILLHLAGPYELWGEWLVRRPAKAVVSASMSALNPLFIGGYPLLEEALASIERCGIPKLAVREWLGILPRVRLIGDFVVPWAGTLADKAEVVLRATGRPMTVEDIVAAIANDFNIRTLRNYLSSDPRFRRLGLRTYGLDEWGGEEYTTISDEITEEIERRGGEARLDDLVTVLTTQFDVAASSVTAYASGPQFERTADGMIRLRSGRARVPTQPVEFTRRCFRIGGLWSYRVTVTHDTLRGSGASVPRGFAGYIQLAHGDEVQYEAPEMMLRFTWPSLLPCVGSLHPVVDALGADEGDYLFLVVDPARKVASIVRVAKEQVSAVGGEHRLLLEVGAMTDDDPVAATANALGLQSADSSWAAVRRRLRGRGEEDLLALIPKDESGGTDGLDDLLALMEA